MVIAALLVFIALLVAWIIAPSTDRRRDEAPSDAAQAALLPRAA